MAKSGAQRKPKLYKYQMNLKDTITKCLSPPDSISSVKFAFFKFGPLCNASESNSFTRARCNIEHIKKDEKTLYSLDFGTLFDQGLETLRKYPNEGKLRDKLKRRKNAEAEAIRKLEIFFRDKGKGFCIDITFTFTLKVVEIHVQRLHNQ